MPGVFSPVLQESQTAIQPQAPINPTDFSGVFNTVAGVVNKFTEEEAPASQKDRDNSALQQFSREQTRLFKQQGQLGPRYRSEVKASYNRFINDNPILAKEAAGLAESVNNVQVANEINFDLAYYKGVTKWLETPEGVAASLKSSVFKDGVRDDSATFANVQKYYNQSIATKFRLQSVANDISSAEGDAKLTDIKKTEIASTELALDIAESNDLVNGFITAVGASESDFSDPAVMAEHIKQVDQAILSTRNSLTEKNIVGLGLSNQYKMEEALAPLVAYREFLTTNRDDLSKTSAAVIANNQLFIQSYFKTFGVKLLSNDSELTSYLSKQMILTLTSGKGLSFDWNAAKGVIEWGAIGGDPISPSIPEGVDPTKPISPEEAESGVTGIPERREDWINKDLMTLGATMTGADRIEFLNGMMSFWNNADLAQIKTNTGYREAAVKSFMFGLASVVSNRNEVMSPALLNRVFNKEFLNVYKALVEADTEGLAPRFQRAVQGLFRTNIGIRATNADRLVSTDPELTGVKWSFEGGVVKLNFTANNPLNSRDVNNLIKVAQERGVPLDVVSLNNLSINMLKDSLRTGGRSRPIRVPSNLEAVAEHLENINKVNTLMKGSFPTISGVDWEASLSKRFKFQTNTATDLIIKNESELNDLPTGTYTIRFRDNDSDPRQTVVVDGDGVVHLIEREEGS